MVCNKIVLVLLLAVSATWAAPRPDPRDLRVVIVKAIQIADIIGEKLAAGIAEAKPIVIELEDELNADLAANVHNVLSKLEEDINLIVERLNTLEKEVTDALDAVQKEAASCIDAADVSLDKVLEVSEKALSDVLNGLKDKYESDFTSVRTQIVTILHNMDDATDLAISTGVACVKKGSTTVKKCLDDNTDAWRGAVTQAAVDATLVANEALALAQVVLPEALTAIQAVGADLDEAADPTWADFAKCVAAL